MILSAKDLDAYRLLQARVTQGMARRGSSKPYWVQGEFTLRSYECLREVWLSGASIKSACASHRLSRSQYYEMEDRFIAHGVPGLLPRLKHHASAEPLERLVVLIKDARPSLSQQAILRIAQAVPTTASGVQPEGISRILKSHGRHPSDSSEDRLFWDRLQRTFREHARLTNRSLKGRKKDQRRNTFFVDEDQCHHRLEVLRELHFNPRAKIKDVCLRHGIALTNYYRLVEEYRLFGPWAVIPARLPGKDTISDELQLTIILEKLEHPRWTAADMVRTLKLRCSRFVIHRTFCRWGLADKQRPAVALDRFVPKEERTESESFVPVTTAYHLQPEEQLLQSRRINRHFELLCRKMRTHAFHLCDPGPLLLAPFVDELGVVQAFEAYGPPQLRGKEISNLALLNVFRIIGGYPHVNHLNNNRDRSVALASGLGMFGTTSRYYQDTVAFKFDHIHRLRCDLVSRGKELELIEGLKVAFDFHFKQFYGGYASEKGIGKGPDKSGDMVPGFRPHVAWDLATNTIITMSYFHGGVRGPVILEPFCQQHIFSVLDRMAIEEIYMDSEYTKEASLRFFKLEACQNGEVYLCLKRNKQITKLIAPALAEAEGWRPLNEEDEYKAIHVVLPKTGVPLQIVILRNRTTKEHVRCFGGTNTELAPLDLLKKYSYRWLIENGLKDLVQSYFLDQINSTDPEKIDFEFYCVMVARLAYESFIKALGQPYYKNQGGNKTTLHSMRRLLLEKRNCTIEQDAEGHFVLTLLDSDNNDLERRTVEMLNERFRSGKNKALWWNNRGIRLRLKSQYPATQMSAAGGR